MNYRLTLAYDGTAYSGWQLQLGCVTVQGVLNEILQRLEGQPVIVHAAGRTDAGVHAEGQVISFRLRKRWDGAALRRALNANLPADIRVMRAELAEDDFHPRYHARGKTYRYQFYTGAVLPPSLVRYTWHYPFDLDLERLRQDGEVLLGTHDFTAFTVTACEVKTHTRTLQDFKVDRDGEFWQLWFCGNGFLRYQVRTMVGALVAANRGRLPAGSMRRLLDSKDRKLAGAAAPAYGLTLVKVEY